jgi:transposase
LSRVLLTKFIPQGQTVSQAHYEEILKQLYEAVHITRPELQPNWILRHDNAPAHKALPVKHFVAEKSVTTMEQPPSSPDLAPNDL